MLTLEKGATVKNMFICLPDTKKKVAKIYTKKIFF